MVAHNVADVSSVFAVMVRRRTFFQEDPSIVFLTVLWLFVAPSDEVEVEPGFVVAALISRADTKCFMVSGERAMLHSLSDSGGFRDPQTSAHLHGMAPGLHNGVVPGAIAEAQSAKASSMVQMLFLLSHRHAAALKSPATKSTFSSSITARIVRISFFPMPRFLA